MRFDPRVVDDRNDGREDSLPADLESVARRLGDEAATLARSYPSRETRPRIDSTTHRRFWRGPGAAAAVVLVAATSWAALRFSAGDATWQGPTGGPLDRPLAGVERQQDSLKPDPLSTPRRAASSLIDGGPRRRLPVMYFDDLTAPEQEAVLDLLEEHAQDPHNLEI